ncbi:putative diguanylate cyclase YdaM [compost metagenome]
MLDTVTASFGVAHAQPGDNLESLLTRADDGLYQAKRNGRNQVFALQEGAATTFS